MAEKVLKRTLVANGLSTEGTKAEMMRRFLESDEIKHGPKATASHSSSNISLPPPEFVSTERSALLAAGLTSTDDFSAEINRRWQVICDLQAADSSVSKQGVTMILHDDSEDVPIAKKLDVKLEEDQIAKLNYIYVGETKDKKHLYVPKPTPTKKRGRGDITAGSDVIVKEEKPTMDLGEPRAEEDETLDMSVACDFTVMRLMKKVKKEHMIPLLVDFGVPTQGSKEEIAQQLADQLHYETDDDAE